MKRSRVLALIALLAPMGALAHHSFAVFFEASKLVTVSGRVEDFQFRNPHGIIRFTSKDAAGQAETWKAETNSPSILERRGWVRDSLKPGDEIIVEGWPARDGSRYLRMRSVKRADGSPVGVPFEQAEQK